MFGWGGSERRATSEKELRDVDMYVYTLPAGLFGRFVGRALRFRVGRFSYTFEAGSRNLKRVEVEADSLLPECEVDSRRFERLPLSFSEAQRVALRTRNYVLDAPRFPRIVYEIDGETEEGISGFLLLHGERAVVKCSKTLEGAELVVRCPIDMREFNLPRYSIFLGLFSVSPHVEVETRVPFKVLKL